MKNVLHTLAAILIAATVSTGAAAQVNTLEPAIGGYSPVSYFTENKAELGSSEFAVAHNGETYFLTSSEQMTLFAEDPERYRPRYKSCPFSLAYGMVLPLDPTNFKIIGDNLLLFHRSEEKDALLEWNSSELSVDELLRRADANVFRLTF